MTERTDLDWRWLDPGVNADQQAWMSILDRCRHDFHQLPGYAQLEGRRLGGVGTAIAIEAPEGAALLPLVLRPLPAQLGVEGIDARSPEAYPAPVFTSHDPAFMAAVIDQFISAMRERGVVSAFIRLHPLLEAPLQACAAHGPVVEHGPTVWIDLQADEATQWADYRALHRRWIRRAQRDGLSVRFDDAFAELDAFFSVYAETMVRRDAAWDDLGLAYLEQLAAVLGSRGFLALVEHEGQVIAGGLYTRSCGIVQYHYGGTATAWQKASPSRLMHDAVRRRCAALGDWRMHLGGGVGTRQDALFEFKAGFSNHRAAFRSWRVVLDAAREAELVERWRVLGGDAELAGGFFPRYRGPINRA
jgi:hypothetical protein